MTLNVKTELDFNRNEFAVTMNIKFTDVRAFNRFMEMMITATESISEKEAEILRIRKAILATNPCFNADLIKEYRSMTGQSLKEALDWVRTHMAEQYRSNSYSL